MTTKYLGTLFAVAILAIAAAGCRCNKASSGIIPHELKVVDAATKLPVAGADVKLSAPGMTMLHRTDERGRIDVGAGAFYSRPKPEDVEVTMQGYNRISFHLTNGLPHTVALTPVQNRK